MSNVGNTFTFRLFARPSFWEGMARVLDLGATLQSYNLNRTGEEADFAALSGDWNMVGRDIGKSLKRYGQEQEQASSAASK